MRYKNDNVLSYFGLRSFQLGQDDNNVTRPVLNGEHVLVYSGFLDQSWWPDGIYVAPTDDALAFDIQVLKTFGMNLIRLHQKINPERWYYWADVTGVIVFQDMVQKYGGASNDTVPLFLEDMKRAILGRKNHPCIVQFTVFNEGDCWNVFNVSETLNMARSLAPDHLLDTDSGGKANDLHIGDVNDIHSYPQPGDTQPSKTQYAMVGEYVVWDLFSLPLSFFLSLSSHTHTHISMQIRWYRGFHRGQGVETKNVPHLLTCSNTTGGSFGLSSNDIDAFVQFRSYFCCSIYADHRCGVRVRRISEF